MRLFGWLRGTSRADDGFAAWRQAWERAVATPADADVGKLRRELDQLAPTDGDVELELEMLDALAQLQQLVVHAAQGALPVVDTQHRVVGTEPCHFTAPASLPHETTQASGRVLITSTRGIFVGAGRTQATAWHAVHEVLRVERDVALLRADRSPAAQFRFNTFTDAILTAFLARHFKNARRARL